ncbi:ras and EF-hand domain-containing protein homolog isoform X2 [Ruditapes philippinarum]|uniref:ras and EF-hand domain-containing protein homolog isoform X2 n=1 Tax=Ruditapes philippinarum TaxID=129788 RepID=UPI00295B32DD|nr:ras and EF-hand domain-containing protein homolog isoform X2 [Ruditapes philippinarum]
MSVDRRSFKNTRKLSLASQNSIELDATKLLELITADDTNGNDAPEIRITRKSLSKISKDLNLTEEELDIIFAALDSDEDGYISSSELRQKAQRRNQLVFERCPSEVDALSELGDELSRLDSYCQEQVCELYQQLHHAGNPELLETYESVILGILKDLRQQQVENDRLEKSFKREKEQHDRHMRQMEEEMELQVQRVEERVRKREEEKKEGEKAEMRGKVQEEINMLQQNLKRLQQDGPEAKNKEIEEQLLHLKGKVEEMTFANRQLKSELTDTQTNLALVKSEFASVKQQLNEKIHELNMEKESNSDYQREQENLTRQLHLLHDANKRLHDTNDDLREAVEVARRASPIRQQSLTGLSTLSWFRRENSSQRTCKSLSNTSTVGTTLPDYRRGSLMSEYFQSTPLIRSRMGSQSSLVEEPQTSSVVTVQNLARHSSRVVPSKLPHQDTCESDGGILEDIDSGHSTLRDGNENDLDREAFLNDAETMHRLMADKRHRRNRSNRDLPMLEDIDSNDELDTESEMGPMDCVDAKLYRNVVDRRIGSGSSRSSSTRSSRSRDSFNRRQSTLTQDTTPKVNKDPERMFKVVLAGDAAVGKSSLIMRLCKGKFVENLSSTLGVDFQTKMIELDGRTVALQLWDTAGQERFRSIAKSYFRRADGVLLLYDCTYERSFTSIREWMDSIEDGSIKKLPIMLCGNKTDMRTEAERLGRTVVSYDDGQRLAREYSALFIETSAKDGSNVTDSVVELTRLMRANEDLEVKESGLQLHDKTLSKGKGCCG